MDPSALGRRAGPGHAVRTSRLAGQTKKSLDRIPRQPPGLTISGMRTFAQKPKAALQPPSIEPAAPGGPIPLPRRTEGGQGRCFAHDFSRVPVKDAARTTLADWLPQTRGTSIERAAVLPESALADRAGANAVTLGSMVHLSSSMSGWAAPEQQRVMAHEAVHVAQQSAPGPSAPREQLEMEAHQLVPQVLSGHLVQPRFRADATMALADDGGPLPGDILAVRKARARREVLLRYKAIYEGSDNTDLAAERRNILERRTRLDDTMAKRLRESQQKTGKKAPDVEEYRQQERKNLAALNRKPVTWEVTKTAVRARVRFQVRFEGLTDKDAGKKFPTLKQSLQQGIRDIWNQKLAGAVLPGRTFEIVPEIQLVSSAAPRDENFWLVTVRPTDKAPLVYEKKNLGKAPDRDPTSVTDPKVGSGVMSIPPSHIGKPDILGHETLHLFGLVDRYFTIGNLGEFQLRETKGRQDPLGADEDTGKVKGKILEEDLGFVLDQFDVYPNLPYKDVVDELKQVEEIIKTGRDPKSLVKKRKNFEPEVIKQAEDLP